MKIAIYPGTFDPVTNGHYDLIKRAACMFENLMERLRRHGRPQINAQSNLMERSEINAQTSAATFEQPLSNGHQSNSQRPLSNGHNQPVLQRAIH